MYSHNIYSNYSNIELQFYIINLILNLNLSFSLIRIRVVRLISDLRANALRYLTSMISPSSNQELGILRLWGLTIWQMALREVAPSDPNFILQTIIARKKLWNTMMHPLKCRLIKETRRNWRFCRIRTLSCSAIMKKM